MCTASRCVSSSQTQANAPALPVWFLPDAFPFVLIYSQGFCLIDLWRRPSHLFHKDYLFKAMLFGQQSTNLVLITFIWPLWNKMIGLYSLKDRDTRVTHVGSVFSPAPVCQRCWGKLRWCHITYNSESFKKIYYNEHMLFWESKPLEENCYLRPEMGG